jgi:hypothetical protein
MTSDSSISGGYSITSNVGVVEAITTATIT